MNTMPHKNCLLLLLSTVLLFLAATPRAAAVYDSAEGRWLSRDLIGEDGGLNLYGYVGNNPANWVDPLGFEPVDIYLTDAFGIPGLNHVYAKDPVTGVRADMHGSLGRTCGSGPAEPRKGDRKVDTIDIPGMSGAKAIDKIQEHIDNNAQKKFFLPKINDCHNALQDAIESLGGKYDESKTPRVEPATPKPTAPPRPATPSGTPQSRPAK